MPLGTIAEEHAEKRVIALVTSHAVPTPRNPAKSPHGAAWMRSWKKHVPNTRVLILLILILVAVSAFRFYGLARQSLSSPELSHWYRSNYDDLTSVINKGTRPDVHPPGYQIVLFFVEKYLGDSEIALRAPSAVSGVASIFVIFLLGSRLYTHREGLVASALMAFLWCPLYYSQHARAYSMLILFSALSTYFWISLLEDCREGPRISYLGLAGYIVTAIVTSYLHYFGLYLVFLQGIGAGVFCLVVKPKSIFYILLTYVLIAAAYVPWIPGIVEDLNRGSIYVSRPTISRVIYCFSFFFNKSNTLALIALLSYLFLLYRSGMDIVIGKKPDGEKMNTPCSPGLFLALWLTVPFLGVYVKSMISTPILMAPYLLISLPAAYLLLSRSVTRLPLRTRLQNVVAIALVCLFLFDVIFMKQFYTTPYKQQFREAVGFIVDRDHLYEDSMIIGCTSLYCNYYFEKMGSDRRIDIMAGEKRDIPKIADIISERNPRYVWFIRAHKHPEPSFVAFLLGILKPITYQRFIAAEVWLFENPAGTSDQKPSGS